MRVLSLSQLFMPDTVGGTGRVARSLSDALIAHGEQVVVLTQRVSAATPVYENPNRLEIYRYGSPPLRRLLGMSASAAIGIRAPLRRLLQGSHYDAAIGHQPVSSLAAAGALRSHGIPELRFFHSSGALETERRLAPGGPIHLQYIAARGVTRRLRLSQLWRMERAYVRTAAHLCFLSRYTQTLATRLHGPDLPPFSIIPAGVDTNRFAPSTDRHGLRRRLLGDNETSVVLFTARNLGRRMGLDTLLHAMTILRRQNPAIRLVIAGQGPMGAALERLVADLRIGHAVSLLGRISDETLLEWYQACDLFVLPSLTMEGFGMVTVEALACGAPVVCTPVGATPELLDGLHPYLLAAGVSADAFASAIARVLCQCDLRILRGQARRHAVERYDVRVQAARVADLLQQMRRGSSPRSSQ